MNPRTAVSVVLVALCALLVSGPYCPAETGPTITATSGTKVQWDDGAEVELVAVSNQQWKYAWQRHLKASGDPEHRKKDLWWRPDGTAIEDLGFERGRQSLGNVNAFNFLVKTTGPKDVGIVACKDVGDDLHKIYRGDVRDSAGQSLAAYRVFYVPDFPYPPTSTSLFVGIADGDWEVVEREEHRWAKYEPDGRDWYFDHALVAKWPYQRGNDVRIELTHTYVQAQTRLEMTDTEGETHIADARPRGKGTGIVTIDYTFEDTSREEMSEIRFMKRDYARWIEFKGVTLAFEGIKPFYVWGRLMELKGNPAPEFAQIQEWSTGKAMKMAELKGKVVLLDFWNVNCSPCVAMMPNLMALYEKHRERGLVIVGVHADIGLTVAEAKAKMAGYKAKQWDGRDVPFPIAFDGGGDVERPGTKETSWGATNAAYAITSYPTTILIDREGDVHGQINLHKPGYEEEILSLLNR